MSKPQYCAKEGCLEEAIGNGISSLCPEHEADAAKENGPLLARPESKRYEFKVSINDDGETWDVLKIAGYNDGQDYEMATEILLYTDAEEICNALNQHQAGSISISRETAETSTEAIRAEKRRTEGVSGMEYLKRADEELSTALRESKDEKTS